MTMPSAKCPCGSGKKFKKCCHLNQFKQPTPAELEEYDALHEKRRAEQKVELRKAFPTYLMLAAIELLGKR